MVRNALKNRRGGKIGSMDTGSGERGGKIRESGYLSPIS